MPTANPPELSAAELELKRLGRRRLIGAMTIGLLAIVILPMIFDPEPRKKQAARQEIEVQIPPNEGLPPLPTPVASLPAVEAASPKELHKDSGNVVGNGGQAAGVVPADVVTAKVSAAEPDKTNKAKPDAVVPSASKSASAKLGAATSTATASQPPLPNNAKPVSPTALSGFVIQLGAYKDADNAKALVVRMQEAKLPVFTDVLPVKTGTVTRVRVGPFPSKEKADGALAKVKLAGVDGKVVPLP
jgi:DedD protein